MKQSELSKDIEYDYIEKAKTDSKFTEIIINHFKNLIQSIIRPYQRDHIDNQDLEHEAIMGVMRAIQDFDPSRNKRFSTYARWWIRAYVREFYLQQSRSVSMSGFLTSQLNKTLEYMAAKEQELSRPLTLEEISVQRGIPLQRLRILLNHGAQSISLDAKATSQDGSSTISKESLPDNHIDSPKERLIRVDLIDRMKQSINCLSSVEKAVIIKRYGLDNSDRQTLQEIGSFLNLSVEGVRQIQERAENKLKKLINR